MPWFAGSRFWFTLNALLRAGFGVVNQEFWFIFKFTPSDVLFCVGSLVPPYRGTPLVNQAIPAGGQGTTKRGAK